MYATYAGLILLFLVRFLPTIFKTEWILLVMALAFYGASIHWEVEIPASKTLFEDGTKYVGMVAWLVYYSRLGASTICQHRAQQSPPPEQSSAAKNPRE